MLTSSAPPLSLLIPSALRAQASKLAKNQSVAALEEMKKLTQQSIDQLKTELDQMKQRNVELEREKMQLTAEKAKFEVRVP